MKKLICFIALLLTVWTVRAEIKVKSFSPAYGDQTATQRPVLGSNGYLCTLIKVKTSTQGILADALQMKETPYDTRRIQTLMRVEQPCPEHSDELWLYLTTETLRFRLMHPQYGLMDEDSNNMRNGYYELQWRLPEGSTYVMEIELTDNTQPVGASITSPTMPEMGEVKVESDDGWMRLRVDEARLKRGTTVFVPEGEHTFREGRFLNPKRSQPFTVRRGESLTLTSHPSELPVSLFAGAEVAKPTSQSEMGYGVRLGIVGRWGVYGSFVRTWGEGGSYPMLNRNGFAFEPLFAYSDPKVSYQSWCVGGIVRCWSCLHLYAGVGMGERHVSWLKDDGQRYESEEEQIDGFTFEAGALVNIHRFYLSGGAERLGDSWVGRVGFGLYLTK